MAKTNDSGMTNAIGTDRWFTVASESNYRFIQQKETKSEKREVKQTRTSNIYVKVTQNDTIQSVSYYEPSEGRWYTITGAGKTEKERRIIKRARRLWQAELSKKRRKE